MAIPKRDRSGEYARRKAKCIQLNICLRCQEPKGTNKWLCNKCLIKTNLEDKSRRNDRKAKGLCKCNAIPEQGKEYCSKCLEENRQQQERRRNEHRLADTCLTCGNEPEPGKLTCADCNKRATTSTLKRYRQNIGNEKCALCGNELDLSTFRCNQCHHNHIKRNRDYWHRRRLMVIEHYGSVCQCCGAKQAEFLDVDHINGGGSKHRDSIDQHFYDWIIKNDFPTELQLLCANCNRGKSKFGVCPHYKNPSPCNTKSQSRKRRQRQRVINKYGGECKFCKEKNWAFLEFDHVNNDGNVHRKTIANIIPWIVANDYPNTMQLLCSNCNKAKGLYEYHPHSEEIYNELDSQKIREIETNIREVQDIA